MKAHELLARENGWCQGTATTITSSGDYQYCAVGALDKCYSFRTFELKLEDIVRRLDIHDPDNLVDAVAEWNDAPGRTQAEVVALLKELDI